MDSDFAKIENPQFYMFDSIILALGITGAGKSSFLNTLVNYLLANSTRNMKQYICSSDSQKSHTYCLYYYSVYSSKYNKRFLLVDTPGFSDTYGEYLDRKNCKEIESFLDTVPCNFSVLYVINSSIKRKTASIAKSIENASKLLENRPNVLANYMILTFSSDQFHEKTDGVELDIVQRFNLSGIWAYYSNVFDVDNIFALVGKLKIKKNNEDLFESYWIRFCTEKLDPLVRNIFNRS
ncbi:hypothetical protein SteCoe_1979 [Stentor coeruleus]|uniref:G domain-containing protein n=1 Tax=Stentor coeruleus TaxID=5963 RepID=A0A1R2D0K3_9CILI|nr:hypothetical protein SteCoe_1979 [Stentor coeruleus]